MRSALIGLLFVATPALAQDPEEPGGTEPPPVEEYTGPSLLDSIDIDLSNEPKIITFTGDFSQKSDPVAPEVVMGVSHPGGSVVVRCADTPEITARINYTIDGYSEGSAQRFGQSIKMSTYGKGLSGDIKVLMPPKTSEIKRYEAALSVTAPLRPVLTVNATTSWVQVSNCGGTVKATAANGGAYVDGPLRGFVVTATRGDAKVVVLDASRITVNSSISAPQGSVDLLLPAGQNLRVAIKGAAVTFDQPVNGTVTTTNVTGTVGAGGPTLTITAGKDVYVHTQ
jgi:hypothetical protein